jgi:hexosaminidase
MDFAATMRLLLSLSFIFGRIHAGSERLHRVFPAAQVELYDIESNTLGVVKPSSLSIKSFGPPTTDKVVKAAINRFQKALSQLPDFVEDYEENPEHNQLQDITTVELHVLSPSVELVEGVDESYILSIEEKSSAVMLRAYTVFGIVHGLETLGQLLEFGWMNDNGETVFTIHDLPLSIEDFPSFEYRGLLIDTSRHYLPLNLILSNLDAMAMNKLNVLHWHLTDSPSFPYQTESMPELAAKGSYHPNMVYTTMDIQTVVEEAYLRGIRVIPEVDLPGHSQSIVASHPELM